MIDIRADTDYKEFPYPWANPIRWADQLRVLAHLRRLSIRTRSSLISRAGNKANELKLITAWNGGVGRYHGHLYRVVLMYGSDTHLCQWVWDNNIWHREMSTANPDEGIFA